MKKLFPLSLLSGLFGGTVGALFYHCVTAVTNLRTGFPIIVALLPLGGLLTVFICKKFGVADIGTPFVIGTLKNGKNVPVLLLPSVFLCTCITHLLGGSAGREGAALQMGSATVGIAEKFVNLSHRQRQILKMCGMSAFFSALFGTPLGAAVFTLELLKKRDLKPLIFTLISSLSAYFVSIALKTHPERFALTLQSPSFNIVWKSALIILGSAALCIVFIFTLHRCENIFKALFKNEYLRISIGAVIIAVLTLAVGTADYNGGGMTVVEKIFSEGAVKNEAFLLKILFTAITVSSGFKGGEIVPTLFIGAAFGGALAIILGLSPALGAALGMTALFCGATKCPVSSVLIACEMFGLKGAAYFLIASLGAFFLSGKAGLYTAKQQD